MKLKRLSVLSGVLLGTVMVLKGSLCLAADQKAERSSEAKRESQVSVQEESHLFGGENAETILELLRELKRLRAATNLRVPDKDVPNKGFVILDVVEPQRVLVVSVGLEAGVTVGSVIKFGAVNAYAKVVDCRSKVSAAVIENSFKGKLADLLGATVELASR